MTGRGYYFRVEMHSHTRKGTENKEATSFGRSTRPNLCVPPSIWPTLRHDFSEAEMNTIPRVHMTPPLFSHRRCLLSTIAFQLADGTNVVEPPR